MADNGNKRYYWLKLSEDFFRQKEIKKLRRIAGGDTYTVIYLKMLLRSMEDGGKLYYEGYESDFASELALDIDEDVENVKMTVAFLIANGILHENTASEFEITTAREMVGSEGGSARRMRMMRAVKAIADGEKRMLSQCDSDVTARDTDIDKEIEIDTDTEIDPEINDDDEKSAGACEEINPYGGDRIGETVQKYALDNLRVMTPGHMQEFNEFMTVHGVSEELMKYAVDVACGNGAPVWNYVAQVLYGWLDAGVKSVGDAKAEQAKRKKKRDGPKPSAFGIDRRNNKIPEKYGGGIIV
jgi:predicted phage replisome organizer